MNKTKQCSGRLNRLLAEDGGELLRPGCHSGSLAPQVFMLHRKDHHVGVVVRKQTGCGLYRLSILIAQLSVTVTDKTRRLEYADRRLPLGRFQFGSLYALVACDSESAKLRQKRRVNQREPVLARRA